MASLALTAWELTCYCVIFTVGLIGNLTVCLVVVKSSPKFRSVPFNIYLMALAITDLCLAITCLPIYVMSTTAFNHPDGYGGTVLCKIITGYLLPFWFGGASIYILVIISFERYEAISNPLSARTRSVTIKTWVNIVFAWLIGIVIEVPTIVGLRYTSDRQNATVGSFCKFTWKSQTVITSIYAFTFTFQYVLPAFIFIINFYRIKKSTGHLDESLKRNFADGGYLMKVMNKKRQTVRIIFIASLAFFICWTPNNVMYFLFQYGNQKSIAWDSTIFQAGIILGYFNSCVNPVLYAFQSKSFREHCKEVLTKSFKCKGSRHRDRQNRSQGSSISGSGMTSSDKDVLIKFEI